MRFIKVLPLSLLLVGLTPCAHATIGQSIITLEFKLNFNASSDFAIDTRSLDITGSFDGAGAHNERWGYMERGGDSANGVPTTEANHAFSETNYWGPLWGIQTLSTDTSVSLSMLTEAIASFPPSSFAWAKSSAKSGMLASVTNKSSTPKEFSFQVSRELVVSIAALADPGEYAYASAAWDYSFSQLLGNQHVPLFSGKDDVAVEASLEKGLKNVYKISSLFEMQTKEATYKTWLGAGETTTFTLERASLHSRAFTAPDGGIGIGAFSAAVGALIVIARRGRMTASTRQRLIKRAAL